jgi:hypothetical protein
VGESMVALCSFGALAEDATAGLSGSGDILARD